MLYLFTFSLHHINEKKMQKKYKVKNYTNIISYKS